MRRQFLTIILSLFSILALCQESGIKSFDIEIDNKMVEIYKQSHAILIGVSEYLNNWPDLPGVKKDIEAVKKALESHHFNVIILENPTKVELDNSISNFIARYGQEGDNRLLFYFGGHGHTINTSYGEKLGYIVPADAPNPNNNEALFQSRAIEMAQIEIYAKRIQSKHAIFLFDACFSGSLFAITRAVPQAISYKTREPIRQFITSGTENEQVPDKSIFRQQFVSALTSNEADGNSDGYLTGNELGEFLQTTVTNYSYNSQHPQYGKIRNPNLDKGDFVFILPGVEVQDYYASITDDTLRGESISLPGYGSLELSTEIDGQLFLDGKSMGIVEANSTIPLDNIPVGEHLVEISGIENWSNRIRILENKVVHVAAYPNAKTRKSDLALTGEFIDQRDDNTYKWIRIGTQIWMAENLNYYTENGSWCYKNREEDCDKFGRLYNWETANKACPEGWHLSTFEEWESLTGTLPGTETGGELKESGFLHWKSPNEGANNNSGFTALPGGFRDIMAFSGRGTKGLFWTVTEGPKGGHYGFSLNKSSSSLNYTILNKIWGLSVRCVKDNSIE